MQPPIKVPPLGRNVSHHPTSSRAWLGANTLPQYWAREADGRTNAFPVRVAADGAPSRNLVVAADAYFSRVAGIAVTEKTVLSEYQAGFIFGRIHRRSRFSECQRESVTQALFFSVTFTTLDLQIEHPYL